MRQLVLWAVDEEAAGVGGYGFLAAVAVAVVVFVGAAGVGGIGFAVVVAVAVAAVVAVEVAFAAVAAAAVAVATAATAVVSTACTLRTLGLVDVLEVCCTVAAVVHPTPHWCRIRHSQDQCSCPCEDHLHPPRRVSMLDKWLLLLLHSLLLLALLL